MPRTWPESWAWFQDNIAVKGAPIRLLALCTADRDRTEYCGAQAGRLTALPHGNIARLQAIAGQGTIARKAGFLRVHSMSRVYGNRLARDK